MVKTSTCIMIGRSVVAYSDNFQPFGDVGFPKLWYLHVPIYPLFFEQH